jgi:asparagine synthetase B (glutamine-hydrolysing)
MLPGLLLAAGARTLQSASRISLLRNLAALRKGRRAMQIARLPHNRRPGAIETLFDLDALQTTASPFLRGRWRNISATITEKILESQTTTRLRQLMHYRVKYSLAEDMLAKVDRMSMAASLEVRAPLLSTEVTDFARRLPDDLLIRKGVKKFILREVGRPWLPDVVYSHPKSGFTIPLHMFQNENYGALCKRYLLQNKSPIITQLFDPNVLAGIVARATHGTFAQAAMSTHRASHQLWGLMQLGAWAHHYEVNP